MSISRKICLVFWVTCFASWVVSKPSSLIAQTECELLQRPGIFKKNDSDTVNRVRYILNPTYVPELAFLTEEQMAELKGISREFSNLMGDFEGDEDAFQRGFELQEQEASRFLGEFERVLGEHWPAVVFAVNRNMVIGYQDPSGLSLSTVADGLKLSPEQKSLVKKLKTNTETRQELTSKMADKLKPLLDEHFAVVKAELDSVQQIRFLKWFGDLNLFKLAMTDVYREMITHASINQGESGSITRTSRNKDEDGKPKERTRKDVEIDTLFYYVLTMENIEDQLDLSSEQLKGIKNQIEGNDIRLVLKNRRTERMLSILQDKWELPRWLDEILLPHQKTWMQQFEFQVYNMPYADSFGVLHPDVSEALKLTEGQLKRIKELALDYRTKVADYSRKTEQAIAKAEREKRVSILKSLSPEQLHQYRLWFGDVPIDD